MDQQPCDHPIKSLDLQLEAGYGDSLLRCPCGTTLRMDRDVLHFGEPGESKRILQFVKARSENSDGQLTVADLHRQAPVFKIAA